MVVVLSETRRLVMSEQAVAHGTADAHVAGNTHPETPPYVTLVSS
jgi:hypothetical protein